MFLNDEVKWEQIRNDAAYQPLRDMICSYYEENCRNQPIPQISFQLEIKIFDDGDRTQFESVYYARRRQLSSYALMTMLYPENDEYLKSLEDVICEICNEYSWQLPSHRPADRFNSRNGIALLSAETGLYLAEIKAMLRNRLHPLVVERITNELKWRIIDSFKNNICVFESMKSNWAAVCGGAVGAIFLYEDADGYMEVKPRIEKCMQNYMDGCFNEGSTSEGLDYWQYGFGYFVLYHDLLRRYTFGRLDYFNRDLNYVKNDKLQNLTKFCNSLCLDEENIVSFSDCSRKLSYTIWLHEFLNREFKTSIPPVECGEAGGNRLGKFSWIIRSCVYYTPGRKTEKLSPMKKHYKEVQWYIERKENYSFAAKGGHNAEEHNHNDIGSFIVTHNKKCIFTDLGAPEYVAKIVGDDDILNKSSLGHSVPIINGTSQKSGREYSGELNVNDNIVNISFAKAYPTAIKSLDRQFELSENMIILCDKFDGAKTVTERFITEIEPVIKTGKITIGDVNIIVDEKHKVSCTCEDIAEHDLPGSERVYKLDFELCGNEFEMKIEF